MRLVVLKGVVAQKTVKTVRSHVHKMQDDNITTEDA
jgi:hypothetical protein